MHILSSHIGSSHTDCEHVYTKGKIQYTIITDSPIGQQTLDSERIIIL